MFLRQIGVIARKPPGRVHPEEEAEHESPTKAVDGTSEMSSDGMAVEPVTTLEGIGTLRFENPAIPINVTVNK